MKNLFALIIVIAASALFIGCLVEPAPPHRDNAIPVSTAPIADTCFPEGYDFTSVANEAGQTADGWRFTCFGEKQRPDLEGCREVGVEVRGGEPVTRFLCPAPACTRAGRGDALCADYDASRGTGHVNAFVCPPLQIAVTPPPTTDCEVYPGQHENAVLQYYCCR
jgi:hypothetical protein